MDLENQTFELLEATATNWTVNKIPLITESGLITDSYGMFRNDTNLWLGTIGKQYEPMQNYEVVETLISATQDYSEIHRGGQLNGGKKVYYQTEVSPVNVGNDEVKRYLTILNSHDGSSSIGFGFSNMVVVCQNTFFKALKDIKKLRHTNSAKERLQIAKEQVRNTLYEENEVMDNFKRMADVKVTNKAIKLIVSDLFSIKEEDFDSEIKEFPTRKINEIKNFKEIMEMEFTSHGSTLWGLFNAVTWKTNHVDTKGKNKLENVMIGAGYKKNNNAYKILSELV